MMRSQDGKPGQRFWPGSTVGVKNTTAPAKEIIVFKSVFVIDTAH